MAINIKELFNADADNIRVDKINYNFDQLLANGGGPVGAKGNSGTTGNTGTKGQKGELGNKGDGGQKGEQGSSANLWDSDTLAITAGDLDVLRPFNNPSDDLRTRIILGQDTSAGNTNPPNTTPTEPAGLLNLVLPPENNDDTTSQIIFINDETGDPREFKMATSYEVGTGSTFTFSALAATSGEKTNLDIQMPNEISITATDKIDIGNVSTLQEANFKASDNLKIESGDVLEITSAQSIEVEGDTISLIGTSGNQISTSSNNRIDAPSGNNMLNAVNNDITGSTKNTISAPTVELSGTGANTVDIIGDLIRLRATNNNGSEFISTAALSHSFRIGGFNSTSTDNKFKIEDILNTSDSSILFSDTDGIHDGTVDAGPTGASTGDGIRFKEGGAVSSPANGNQHAAAPNNGSTIPARTLSDYFYEDDVDLWVTRTNNMSGHIKGYDAEIFDNSGPYDPHTGAVWYDGDYMDDTDVLTILPLQTNSSSTAIDSTNWGYFNYTKIGNIIHAMGSVTFCGPDDSTESGPNEWTELDNESRHAVVVDFNNTNKFPYVNASSSPIIANVSFGGNDKTNANLVGNQIITGTLGNATGAEHGEEQFDSPNVGPGIRDMIKLKGIINPGRNEMILVYDAMNTNQVNTGGTQNDFATLGLCPAYFNKGFPVTINFDFIMHTEWNSYNRITTSTISSSGVEDEDETSTP